MATNFKPWIDNAIAGQHVQASSVFAEDLQRINGFIAGDLASALRVNSALRQSNLVVTALMEMCDGVIPLPSDLSLLSSVEAVKNAIYDSIRNVNNDKTFVKVYKSISDFPSFTTSNTINELCEAMADNSYLSINTSGYANLCPSGETDSNGLLEIVKLNANRVRLMWSYSNASKQPVYVGVYRNTVGFSGWKQIFTTDKISTVMPTSGTKSDLKVPSEALFYDQLALKAPLANPQFTGQILRRPEGDFASSGLYGQSLMGTYFITHTVNTNVTQFAEMNISGTAVRQAIDLKISSYYPADAIYDGQLMVTIDVYRSATSGNPEVNIKGTSVITPTNRFGAFYWTFDGSIIKFFYKAYTNYRYVTATVAGMSGWGFNANMFKFLSPLVDTGSTSAPATPSGGSAGQFLHTDYTQLAPTKNPTFTGTVTVPTPNNSTDAANKAYVDDAIAPISDKFVNSVSTTTLFKSDTGVGGSWTYGNYVWTTILPGVDIRGKKLLIYSGSGEDATNNQHTGHTIVIPKASSAYTLFENDYISTESGLMSKYSIVLRYSTVDGLQMSSRPRYVKVNTSTGLFIDDTTTLPSANVSRYVYAIYQIND